MSLSLSMALCMLCIQSPISVSEGNLAPDDESECLERLVQAYKDCGNLSVIEGTLGMAGVGELLLKGSGLPKL